MPASRAISSVSAARDPAEAIFAAGGPNLALADDEEVRRIAGRDESMRVEHQRFVGTRLGRLDRGEDAVELRVRVDLLVLNRRVAAADVDGEELEPALIDRRVGLLVLGDDDDGGSADHDARILVRRGANAARHHQPDMDALFHAVGVERVVKPLRQLLSRQADVHCDRLGAFEQPVEVAVEEGELAPVDPQALPHAVAKHEAAVEHRHDRLSRAASARR